MRRSIFFPVANRTISVKGSVENRGIVATNQTFAF